MALLTYEGFEVNALSDGWSGASLNYSSTGARTGTGYHEADSQLIYTLPANESKVTAGAACQFTDTPSSALMVFSFRDSGAVQHLTLAQDTATGATIKLRRGSATGTLIADTGIVPTPGAWYYVEMQATIDDTVGICKVKIDNVLVIDYVGDTRNAGTANIKSILGMQSVSGGSWKQDDFYVLNGTDDTTVTGRPDNDFLGPVRVQVLYPNGNGTVNQWVGTDGNSVDNYLLVDEPNAPNTTDYVSAPAASPGTRDMYALTDPMAGVAVPLALRSSMYHSKSDTGPAFMRAVLRDPSGAESLEASVAPAAAAWTAWVGPIRKTKPSGGAWTLADITGLQAGVEVTSS